jgi:hypothetical protein
MVLSNMNLGRGRILKIILDELTLENALLLGGVTITIGLQRI